MPCWLLSAPLKSNTTGESMAKTTLLIDAHCVMCNGLARFLRKRTSAKAELNIEGIQSEEASPHRHFPGTNTIHGHPLRRSKRQGACSLGGRHSPAAVHEVVLRHVVPVGLVGSAPTPRFGVLVRLQSEAPVWSNRWLEVQIQHHRCVVRDINATLANDAAIHQGGRSNRVQQEVINAPTSVFRSGLSTI